MTRFLHRPWNLRPPARRAAYSAPRLAAIAAGLLAQLLIPSYAPKPAAASDRCPAALEQVERYQVAPGDTLESIAADYNLQASTILSANPEIASGLSPGAALLIPPFNGRAVTVPAGASWQSLAEQYGSRADLLFELNGCLADVPERIFIPNANPIGTANRRETTALSGYPLAQPADIARSYGWQPHATRDELIFNSGIAFAVPSTTEVLAVEAGTVAFAGQREGYGLLVVINHQQGLQTRYANLSDISVVAGQSIGAEASVGKVGGSSPSFLYFEVRTNSASGWIAQDPGQYVPSLELR